MSPLLCDNGLDLRVLAAWINGKNKKGLLSVRGGASSSLLECRSDFREHPAPFVFSCPLSLETICGAYVYVI